MRQYDHEILNIIKKRWSPRAISSEPIDQELIKTILEAARFAPSCFNEQPWRFIVANTESSLQKMRSLLAKENQIWANSAPVLIMVLCNNRFTYNDKDNFWAKFDTGASWAFLSLEATEHELVTHAMGGFNRNNAISAYSLDPNTEPIAIIAMGKYGDPALLPNSLKEREFPESRKELDELIVWDK